MFRSLLGCYAESSEHLREIVRGASIALPMRAMGMLAGFTLNIALGRILGAEGAGLYFLAFTLTLIIAELGRVGLDNVVLRLTASAAARDDWSTIKGVRRNAMRITVIAAGALAFVVASCGDWFSEAVFRKPALGSVIVWMALAALPASLCALQGFVLFGLKRIPAGVFVSHVGTSSFALAGVLLLAPVWGPEGAAVAYGGAALVTLGIGIRQWRRVARPHSARAAYPVSALLESGTPLFWANVLHMVILWSPIVLLGIWASSADVGIFASAQRTAALTGFVFFASSSILSPKFAELIGRRELWALARTTKASSELMLLVASPLFLLLLLFSSRVMGVFGADFLPGATTLKILAAGQLFNVATIASGQILVMSANERLVRNNTLFCAIANLVLNVALIPTHGIVGAAVANSLTIVLRNLITAWLIWKRLRVFALPFLPARAERAR